MRSNLLRLTLAALFLAVTGCGSSGTAGPPPPPPPTPPSVLVISTGQSNAIGYGGAPALSTTPPYGNIYEIPAASPMAVPLAEPLRSTAVPGESHVASMARFIEGSLRRIDPAAEPLRSLYFSSHGVPGAPYSGICRQGSTTAYADSIEAVRKAKALADSTGVPLLVPAVVLIHGESDSVNGNTGYKSALIRLQADYDREIRAITGQAGPVRLFVTQSYGAIDLFGGPDRNMTVKVAQLSASLENDNVVLVGPTNFLAAVPPRDLAHLDNRGYRRLGEFIGKVIDKVAFRGEPWSPLSPESVSVEGRFVDIRFRVPVPPLRFDDGVPFPDRGFEYLAEGERIPVESVALAGPDRIRITLGEEPVGASQELRYGYSPQERYPNGGGALLDSDRTESPNGYDLANRCVSFRYRFTFGSPVLE